MGNLLLFQLLGIAAVGVCLGAVANLAIYRWAWNPRDISPWSPAPSGQPARTWVDRIPVLGWFWLRREAGVFGAWFWVRPLLIELSCGVALAWLYWWEVVLLMPIRAQLPQLLLMSAADLSVAPVGLMVRFCSHGLLFLLMVVASFIDIDEKIIPDEVTVPGVLLGLLLATWVPMSHLPHVAERAAPPVIGEELRGPGGAPLIGSSGGDLFLEPVTAAAPNHWPAILAGAPKATSLWLGLGCYWLWCFALTTRIWRGRRGTVFALRLIASRICRELRQPPLLVIALAGTAAVAAVWWLGGHIWIGLLTGLLGMIGSGGIVWAIRIAAGSAMGQEALGFGDVTLMMMVGAFLGWQVGVVAFFLAPLAGVVVGVIQLILIRDNLIPFGPFLCLATATTVVMWAPIWRFVLPLAANPLFLLAALFVCLPLIWLMLAVLQLIKKLFLRG